ncbi:MAG TPA: helix-turn-helix domain-containing protein [Mycobacteriales bacterium]|nr:helix-turn-helix domain-containing protein [Mycobacteriales bacterium]
MGTPERRAVQRALRRRQSAVADALIEAITAEIPAYRLLAEAQLAEVRAIGAWALARILALWVEDGELASEDVTRFRGIGAARAMDGRPLPVVLRAYRIAASRATDLILEEGGARLGLQDAVALARLWLASVDTLSEAVYAGYTAAADRLAGDRARVLDDLLGALLDGRHTSPSALADRCRELGVVLPARPCVVVVSGDAGGVDGVLSRVRDDHTVILRDADTDGVDAALAARSARGCAVEASGAAETARAYRLASDALAFAPAHAFEGRALLRTGDAQVLALLAARGTALPAEVVRSVLGGLVEPRARHLLEGLAAFLTTGSATAAAAALGLHPQTLRYRLRRVTALTGRDPRRPWDRLVLDVARTVAGLPGCGAPTPG